MNTETRRSIFWQQNKKDSRLNQVGATGLVGRAALLNFLYSDGVETVGSHVKEDIMDRANMIFATLMNGGAITGEGELLADTIADFQVDRLPEYLGGQFKEWYVTQEKAENLTHVFPESLDTSFLPGNTRIYLIRPGLHKVLAHTEDTSGNVEFQMNVTSRPNRFLTDLAQGVFPRFVEKGFEDGICPIDPRVYVQNLLAEVSRSNRMNVIQGQGRKLLNVWQHPSPEDIVRG